MLQTHHRVLNASDTTVMLNASDTECLMLQTHTTECLMLQTHQSA